MHKRGFSNNYVEKAVNSFGTKVLVRVGCVDASDCQVAESFLSRLTLAWKDCPEPIKSTIDKPVVKLCDSPDENFEQIQSTMSTQVTLASLKANAGNLIMLHAGGIADLHGGVAVLVGPSGRGKTTTTRFLAQSYGYVSDETIAIKKDGEVVPYRKPLSIIEKGYKYKRQIAPSDLGLLSLPESKLQLRGIAECG